MTGSSTIERSQIAIPSSLKNNKNTHPTKMSHIASMQDYIRYMRLWGSFPVSLSEDMQDPGTKMIVPSTISRILHVIAGLALLIISETTDMENTDVGTLALVVELTWRASVMGVVLAWVLLAWKTHEFCAIFRVVSKADLILMEDDIYPNFRWLTALAWIWTGAMHVAVLAVNITEIFWPLWVASGPKRFWILQGFFTLQIIGLSSMTFFYWSISYRFHIINSKLQELAPPNDALLSRKHHTFIATFPTLIKEINGRIPQILGVRPEMLQETIENLQICHFMLSTACDKMMNIYSWPILMELIHATLEFACGVYKTALMDPNDLTYTIILCSCKWGVLSLMRFLVVVIPLSCVTIKANNTWQHVSRLLLTVRDSRSIRQLEMFALQISRPLQFRPFTTLTMDMGIFLSMVSAVITYVVILLQYKQS